MKCTVSLALLMLLWACTATKQQQKGWTPLFDGVSLNNWKASEHPATFSVADGAIVVHGPRAHLFYSGPLPNGGFKNFELKAQVMTTPGSNSGIFIHTAYQENGWPEKGYEIQVNNSHTDWRRTGSLYAVQDVKDTYVKDGEWFTEYIRVEGNRVMVKINDRTVVDYTEPEGVDKEAGRATKRLSSGTIALQGHDPASKVYFKDVQIRPLP